MDESSFPYVGIASFFKAPYVRQPTRADGEVAVLGVPFDEATTSRPGTRYGPRAIREASTLWAYRSGSDALYDGESGSHLLGGVRFVDVGDVGLGPTWPEERRIAAISDRVRPLLAAGLLPVILGGDHSITYPVLAAYGELKPHLVQLDTHMDYWDEEGGMRYTHASPIIRVHEEGLVSGVSQYGIRGLHTQRDNIELARARGVHTFWCEQAKGTPVEELVAHIGPGSPVYITLDIDALDPAIAPGTGTPEPGGFSYYEAKALLRAAARRGRVVGMDVVEVSPPYDGPGQLTALHATRLILDTIGAALPSTGFGSAGHETTEASETPRTP
jgi:agmatinase